MTMNNHVIFIIWIWFEIFIHNQKNWIDNYAVRANIERTSVNFRTGELIEQECTGQTNGESLEIEWYDQRGRSIRNDNTYSVYTDIVQESPLSKSSKLTIRNANRNSAGIYECRVIVGGQKESVRFELIAQEPSLIFVFYAKIFIILSIFVLFYLY